MRQLIIVRKDLGMSVGKTAAQVSHASMAFLTRMIQQNTNKYYKYRYSAVDHDSNQQLYKRNDLCTLSEQAYKEGKKYFCAKHEEPGNILSKLVPCDDEYEYRTDMVIDNTTYEEWIGGIFTKTVCEAKNRNQLLKVLDAAQALGMKENEDYFLIKDACLTELAPEETDENGNGWTLTCIGFCPLPDDIAYQLSKKYQLLK